MTKAEEVMDALHELQVGDRVILGRVDGTFFGYITHIYYTTKYGLHPRAVAQIEVMDYIINDGHATIFERYPEDVTWWPE